MTRVLCDKLEVLLMTDSLLCHRKGNTPLLPLGKREGLPHCHRNQMT